MVGGPGAAAAPRAAGTALDAQPPLAAAREPLPAPADGGMAPAPAAAASASSSANGGREGGQGSGEDAAEATVERCLRPAACAAATRRASPAYAPADSSFSTGEKNPPQPPLASSSCLRARACGWEPGAGGEEPRVRKGRERARRQRAVLEHHAHIIHHTGSVRARALGARGPAADSPLHRFLRHAHRRQRAHRRRGCERGQAARRSALQVHRARRPRGARARARSRRTRRRRGLGAGGGRNHDALAVGRRRDRRRRVCAVQGGAGSETEVGTLTLRMLLLRRAAAAAAGRHRRRRRACASAARRRHCETPLPSRARAHACTRWHSTCTHPHSGRGAPASSSRASGRGASPLGPSNGSARPPTGARTPAAATGETCLAARADKLQRQQQGKQGLATCRPTFSIACALRRVHENFGARERGASRLNCVWGRRP